MVQPEHVVHGPDNHMFNLIHKTCRTGLADLFNQGSGGGRRLAFAVPNYSLDACMNPFSQMLPSRGSAVRRPWESLKILAPHRLDREGVTSSSGSWAQEPPVYVTTQLKRALCPGK